MLLLIGFALFCGADNALGVEKTLWNSLEGDTTQVHQFLEEGKQAYNSGDFERAGRLILRADSLSEVLGYMEGRARATAYKADMYIDQDKLDEAIELLENAIKLYPESEQRAQYLNLLGTSFNNFSDPSKAIQYYTEALNFTDRLRKKERDRLHAAILHNLAVIYQNLGEEKLAFENFLSAITYAEQAKDTSMLAIAYNNIGLAYNNSGDYEKSIYYLNRSLSLAETLDSKLDIYRAHLNLANTLSNMERFQEALHNYEIAESIYKQLRPDSPPAIILHNRGSTLAKMKRYAEAETLLNESLKMCEDLDIREGMYYNHNILGQVLLEQGRNEEAIFHLNQAILLAKESGNAQLIQSSRQALYKSYAAANKYKEAFSVLNTYKAFSDSLTNLEKEKELATIENKLELNRQSEINRSLEIRQAQQEKQLQYQLILIVAGALVILLVVVFLFMMRKSAREKEEILKQVRTQKEELEQLNRSKDKLFAIIAHDLRSPMSSMQGVLHLIKDHVLSQKDMSKLIQELEVSVQQNVDVMEDLLAWAKEQLSGVKMEKIPVNVQSVVGEVISSQSFLAAKKGISVSIEVPESKEVLADPNALQLVIRNLISNSIKYTKEGDEIKVSLSDLSSRTRLIIKDTGIGIPEEAADKIFESRSWTREGTQREKGSGFGLSLSKEFVERMNGKIWFESEVGKGSTFYVELPKA